MTRPSVEHEAERLLAELDVLVNAPLEERIKHLTDRLDTFARTIEGKWREAILADLKRLSDDLMSACVDREDMQMTWNSALHQSANKIDALARLYRKDERRAQEARGG